MSNVPDIPPSSVLSILITSPIEYSVVVPIKSVICAIPFTTFISIANSISSSITIS